jgi:hypothetical protein
MILLGITIGIALIWAWYYWSVRHYRLAANVEALSETGRTIQLAVRLTLECIGQGRYTDAKFHLDTAKLRHKRFRAVHPKTIALAHLLAQEIECIEQVYLLGVSQQFNKAQSMVLQAAEKYVEYKVYMELLEAQMNEYE